jgi:alpha-L-rhamnosidase
MPLFWSKFINDIETARNGDIPHNISPGKRSGGSDPDWGAAFIQLPWNLFLYYGDKSIISKHYTGMTVFMDYLQKIADNNLDTRVMVICFHRVLQHSGRIGEN